MGIGKHYAAARAFEEATVAHLPLIIALDDLAVAGGRTVSARVADGHTLLVMRTV
jgi:hypothetical protein